MKRLWFLLPLIINPAWAIAAEDSRSVLNFTPPSTDYSVVFLSNIFGVVDGVLHGTGSQILGTIFGVFNSAVLALGGILLLYTLVATTLNTAHEGEILGKKWSSIWIPVRTVFGVAMMLPKASGYCMMQIFFMWIVVQGVGAADRVWSTALGYFQRGGVLVQPIAASNRITGTGVTPNDSKAYESQQRGAAIINAQKPNSYKMLQLAVCANSLERMFKDYHDYLRKAGKCQGGNSEPYCDAVPNFTNQIDFVGKSRDTNPSVMIPEINDPPYNVANGACGTISWTGWSQQDSERVAANTGLALDSNLLRQASQARSIAVQQMWMEMSSAGRMIVSNRYERDANNRMPLGVSSSDGLTWSSPIRGATALMSGTEIADTAAIYLGIMTPTLNALSRSVKDASQFIEAAKAKGWIMAGSYFFELANLNKQATGYANDTGAVTVDNTGAFSFTTLANRLGSDVFSPQNTNNYSELMGSRTPPSDLCGSANSSRIQSVSSYICNALRLKSVGQLGGNPPQFAADFRVSWSTIPLLPHKTFSGGKWGIPGRAATFIYLILRVVFNLLINILNQVLAIVLTAIFKPIILMTIPFFMDGITAAMSNYTNPIIALAATGNNFLNLATAVWLISLVSLTAISAIPNVGPAGVTLAMMLMPFLTTWLATMFAAGITFAFYIPLMPYVLFTFAALGWFVSVLEAMAAAPLVALGITYPEGHDIWGKGESAVMKMVELFLRPTLLIIGFIAGLILAYVGIWLLNTGYQSAITGLIGPSAQGVPQDALWSQAFGGSPNATTSNVTGFAAIIGIIVLIVVYITMYVSIVKMCLEQMMFHLVNSVLVWIGGQGGNHEASTGLQAVEGAVGKAGQSLQSAGSQARSSVKSASDQKRADKAAAKKERGSGKGSGKADDIQSASMADAGAGVTSGSSAESTDSSESSSTTVSPKRPLPKPPKRDVHSASVGKRPPRPPPKPNLGGSRGGS